MSRLTVLAVAWTITAGTTTAAAQIPDLSGTWRLDLAASRIARPPLRGGGDGGPADTLHITHVANGPIIVGNEVNAAQAWTYEPGGETTIPVGEGDRLAVRSRWEDGVLVSEGRREPGSTQPVLGVTEIYAVHPDRRTLTVRITTLTSDGEHTNTLVYRRVG